MKNVKFCIVLLFAVMAFSCSTTGSVYDNSTPPEQSTKVFFYCFKPTAYNGILFEPKDGRVGLWGSNYIITFPAGKIDFSGDINWASSSGNVNYSFEYPNAAFSCKVEAGKEYWAMVAYEMTEDNKNRIWGINLYDEEIRVKVGWPSKDNLIVFIPFDPPVISN